jgi:hypothetical protein
LDYYFHSPISHLASPKLKSFLGNVFSISLNENLMLGLHRHNPPSNPGWVHTDFTIVSFPNIPPNFGEQRIFIAGPDIVYADDSKSRQPNSIKTARAIACIYYIANPEWNPSMGGETGIFDGVEKKLVARIPPKNNTLFAFEVTPSSYHTYLGSKTIQRNSFIWWYHADPRYLLRRNASNYRIVAGQDPWDRWTDATTEKYEVALETQQTGSDTPQVTMCRT